jgi:hypothetical protein
MKHKYRRVARHLYCRQYATVSGDWTTLYYARFVFRLKKKKRVFPLGSDSARAKDHLKKLEARDVDRYDFDLDRQRIDGKVKVRDGKSEPFTFQ